MDIILFTTAGLLGLWILITMIRFMGIKEFLAGMAFFATLIIVISGILRGAANQAGLVDRELPSIWGAIERVFR